MSRLCICIAFLVLGEMATRIGHMNAWSPYSTLLHACIVEHVMSYHAILASRVWTARSYHALAIMRAVPTCLAYSLLLALGNSGGKKNTCTRVAHWIIGV